MTDQKIAMNTVPVFAIVGHPNEGKSSVLSTLSEDDSVRVSSTPGETTQCQPFPVMIDGREIIRFIDTPGFQNPRRIMAWMHDYSGPDQEMLAAFISEHKDDPIFHDDCALLTPLAEGAGLIFVVDGSRPLRNIDRAEMEVLRLTGCPRMAIINCKEDEPGFLDGWQAEFRKYFNSIRLFNANRATFSQRIALLSSLKSIDQNLEGVLETVIQAVQSDWQSRNHQTASLLVAMLNDTLSYHKAVACPDGTDEKRLQEKLHTGYTEHVSRRERTTHQQIRSLFKHNIFNLQLPGQSILQQDLFSAKTWEFLGLTSGQLMIAGAVSGAALGAGIDVAAAGLSFGIFATIGSAMGAATAALKGRELLSGTRLLGVKLDRQQLQVGPVTNIQLLYILLDRALIFYSHIINWAHGRRDYADTASIKEQHQDKEDGKHGYTSLWSRKERAVCEQFFKSLSGKEIIEQEQSGEALTGLIQEKLQEISVHES